MNDHDFSTTFTVGQTPEEAFAAINRVDRWWSEGLEGSSDKVGAEFIYRHGDAHYSKQKVTELIPGKKIVWLVLDSHLGFVEPSSEWNGTTVTFDIAQKGDETEVRLTHAGLVPELACYRGCTCRCGWHGRRETVGRRHR
jgi:hypothetical protein